MTVRTVYYAHPVSWYGTREEAADLAALRLVWGPKGIINPGDPEVQEALGSRRNDMQAYLDIVKQVDGVVYRTFKDGRVSAGVAREVMEAVLWGKPVWKFHPRTHGFSAEETPIIPEPLTIRATRARIKEGIL